VTRAKPNQTKPNQTKPNQTKPNHVHVLAVCIASLFTTVTVNVNDDDDENHVNERWVREDDRRERVCIYIGGP